MKENESVLSVALHGHLPATLLCSFWEPIVGQRACFASTWTLRVGAFGVALLRVSLNQLL